MVQQHNDYAQFQDDGQARKTRRSSAPGLTISHLEQLTRLNRRTIAEYIRRGLITAPKFRGTATRYQPEHLLRLVAIQLLKSEGTKQLKEIHAKLQAMGNQELGAWLQTRSLPDDVARALGFRSPTTTTTPLGSQPALTAELAIGTETWHRLRLLPGLELSWQKDKEPLAQHLAEQLRAHLLRLAGEVQLPSAASIA